MSDHHPRTVALRRTICEVHKEMHDIAHVYIKDEDIRNLMLSKIDDATDMGRRMDLKLKEYAYKIARTEWRGWERVNPYRKLIAFYRGKRKLGIEIPDPYRQEAEDLKNGIERSAEDGYLEVPNEWRNMK